jgi:hypothetical protein
MIADALREFIEKLSVRGLGCGGRADATAWCGESAE